eukprot:2997983-Rhodomonas_salina.2
MKVSTATVKLVVMKKKKEEGRRTEGKIQLSLPRIREAEDKSSCHLARDSQSLTVCISSSSTSTRSNGRKTKHCKGAQHNKWGVLRASKSKFSADVHISEAELLEQRAGSRRLRCSSPFSSFISCAVFAKLVPRHLKYSRQT